MTALLGQRQLLANNSYSVLAALSGGTLKQATEDDVSSDQKSIASMDKKPKAASATTTTSRSHNKKSEDNAKQPTVLNNKELAESKKDSKKRRKSRKEESVMPSLLPDTEKSATYPPMPRPNAIKNTAASNEDLEEAPLFVLVTTYLGYMVLIAYGHLRDFFGKLFKKSQYAHLKEADVLFLLLIPYRIFLIDRFVIMIGLCAALFGF